MLHALNLALHEKPKLYLLVIGTGELLDEACKYSKELDLPVTFGGFLNQTEIARAYVAADCLVLPSDFGETWGLVVNEAMACGLPVIVSDRVGCGPDLVEEGVTGYTFPCGDIGRLASRLVTLSADHGRLRRMGEQARLRIMNYSVEHAVAGTLQAIDSVVRKAK